MANLKHKFKFDRDPERNVSRPTICVPLNSVGYRKKWRQNNEMNIGDVSEVRRQARSLQHG